MPISNVHTPFHTGLSAFQHGLGAQSGPQAGRPEPVSASPAARIDATLQAQAADLSWVYGEPQRGQRSLGGVVTALNAFVTGEMAALRQSLDGQIGEALGAEHEIGNSTIHELQRAGKEALADLETRMLVADVNLMMATGALKPVWSMHRITDDTRALSDADFAEQTYANLAETRLNAMGWAMETLRHGTLNEALRQSYVDSALAGSEVDRDDPAAVSAATNAALTGWAERMQGLAPLSESERETIRDEMIAGYRAAVRNGDLALSVADRTQSYETEVQSPSGETQIVRSEWRVVYYGGTETGQETAEAFFDRFFESAAPHAPATAPTPADAATWAADRYGTEHRVG